MTCQHIDFQVGVGPYRTNVTTVLNEYKNTLHFIFKLKIIKKVFIKIIPKLREISVTIVPLFLAWIPDNNYIYNDLNQNSKKIVKYN